MRPAPAESLRLLAEQDTGGGVALTRRGKRLGVGARVLTDAGRALL